MKDIAVIRDTPRALRKAAGPARCAGCNAAYRRGRWTWATAPEGARMAICPACRRTRQRLPAGFVTLRGSFLREHRVEIIERVRACERAEKREHALERIMAIEARSGGLLVTTTDSHLARRIGHALRDAFKGDLRTRYSRAENILRVTWSREQ
jgi:hypothetical protein